jgi:hypothetical protein
MLTFQRVRPSSIWSSRALDIGKHLRGCRVVTPAGRFGQVNKMVKFNHVKNIIYSPLVKCVAACPDLKKNKPYLKLNHYYP